MQKLHVVGGVIFWNVIATGVVAGAYYDKKYYEYQRPIGMAGGLLNRFKFADFTKPTDTVIDFGCGGGFLLNNLQCSKKIGVEINPYAAEEAKKNGVTVYNDLAKINNDVADVIISNHALEHVFNPFETLVVLKDKLKKNGLLVVVVPSEQAINKDVYEYKKDDVNKHLYTWTPLTLGNLISAAGFVIVKAEALRHCWVGDYVNEAKAVCLDVYHLKCRRWALETNNYQVRVVAAKR